MTRENQIKFAKVLLSFSVILMLIGISFGLEDKNLMNPVTNTHVIGQSSDNDINITTTDTPITSEETPTEEQPPSSGGESSSANSNSNANSNSGSSSSGGNSNTTTPPPQTTQPSQPTPAPTPTIEETNNNLRNNIQNTYGITVRYGAETNGYTVAGLSTVMLSDQSRINQLLNELNNNLALYPSGFFNETRQGGYSLTIYLIKQYSQANVTGITDSTTRNVLISLATDYSFTESLHHEIYHYVEKYMYNRGANYTTWNALNPSGFNYGGSNASLSYTSTGNINASFVNNYAQTDEYEDRASTFEYMMDDTEAGCLQTGTPIWKKAKYICEQIDAVFQTVTPSVTEYWERFVYN